jgi:hypothetical protein
MSFQNQGEAITPVKNLANYCANYYRGMKYHTNSYFYPETLTHNSKPQLETSTRKLNSRPQLETSTRNPNSKPPTRNLNAKPQLETSTRNPNSKPPNCTRHLNSKPELEPRPGAGTIYSVQYRYHTGDSFYRTETEPCSDEVSVARPARTVACGADLGSVATRARSHLSLGQRSQDIGDCNSCGEHPAASAADLAVQWCVCGSSASQSP